MKKIDGSEDTDKRECIEGMINRNAYCCKKKQISDLMTKYKQIL